MTTLLNQLQAEFPQLYKACINPENVAYTMMRELVAEIQYLLDPEHQSEYGLEFIAKDSNDIARIADLLAKHLRDNDA